jgi:hypothetical protein
MGSKFLKAPGGPRIAPTQANLSARAFGSANFSGRASAGAAVKDVAAAAAFNKAGAPKKSSGSSAYPKGPRI